MNLKYPDDEIDVHNNFCYVKVMYSMANIIPLYP